MPGIIFKECKEKIGTELKESPFSYVRLADGLTLAKMIGDMISEITIDLITR